jgi:hypothetical protein
VEGDGPLFTTAGEILFRSREGDYGFAYRVRPDGAGLRRASDHPVIEMASVSPDDQWLLVYARAPNEQVGTTIALRLAGGPPVEIYGQSSRMRWSRDGRSLFLMDSTGTFVLPVPRGRTLPVVPEGGFRSREEIAKSPGVTVIESDDVAPGPVPGVYAFSRETVQRNLYRVPLP